MTDIESDPEENPYLNENTLELMIEAEAGRQFEKAVAYPGGIKAYFKDAIKDVASDFKHPEFVARNVYNFATDRYIFYRRHKELEHGDAVTETYIDTFEYLIQLKNDFPMVEAAMRDRWRG